MDAASLFHPQYLALLDRLRADNIQPADPLTMPLAEARARAELYHATWNRDLPPVEWIAERTVRTSAGPLSLRLYVPDRGRALPVLVYFHGGGFVLNSIDSHDRLLRLLAVRSGAAVCAVRYSRAPEARFPVQADQAAAVMRWLATHGEALGLDTGRLAVGGDSAGANLALSAALALRDAKSPRIKCGLLFYGMFCADFDTESHRQFGGGGFGLTTARMRWFWDCYLGGADPKDPRASLLLADLRGLPPMLVSAAELDCLRDDSLRLARRLDEAKVPHQVSVYSGVPHSFVQMSPFLDLADLAISEAADYLRHHLTVDRTAALCL